MNDPLPRDHASPLTRADRAFARAAGSDPIDGNAVRLLCDAAENFPAWLAAIRGAERSILIESYVFANDDVGREFASALAARARAGVRVHAIYDWVGAFGARALWPPLIAAGGEVRAFNPLRFDSPLGWLSRDHRKTLVVDGRIGFVTGIGISAKWLGNPARGMEPWRDAGIEICGPAVVELVRAFAQVWQACGGTPLPAEVAGSEPVGVTGETRLRVVAGSPNATGTYRLDLVIASLARQTLWLTDAYFVGTSAYVQALAAAARDEVDVRLLVPGASDIPALSPLSRAGFRPLLESGVRVFEWNGTMLHAKSAVADRFWSRIGSTNLNIASWLGNYELDVAVEDVAFGERMAAQFEADLARATEVVLTRRNRVRRVQDSDAGGARHALSGSAGRAAAGAVSVGSALGAALTNRRLLGPAESGLLIKVSLGAIALAIVAAIWPAAVAWPIAILAAWFGVAWLARAIALRRKLRDSRRPPEVDGARSGVDGGSPSA